MVATVAREVELWIKKLELLDLDLGLELQGHQKHHQKNKVLGFQ
jgi:hypothetical protein